jgi:mono/diheme cytochrome c family protein
MKATVVLTIGVVALMAALGSAQAQVAAAGKAQAPDAKQLEKGMAVYAAQKCSMCHSIEGKGQAKGPLDGVGTKLKADEIREWVLHPADMTKKTNAERKPSMRAYPNLPKEDLDALVAYLASLKKK